MPGVADHPQREKLQQLWLEGERASTINFWLQENGHDTLNPQTLNKYGQRYWTERVEMHWSEDPLASLQSVLDQVENEGLGVVTKTTVTKKAYPAWKRDAQGEDAVSLDANSSSVVLSLVPEQKFPFERAQKTNIKLNFEASKKKKTGQWKTLVFLPDMQIGYFAGEKLIATHDEVAIDLAHQILKDLVADDGVEVVINAGDNLDLPAFTKHRSAPGYVQTTQFAIDRASQEAAMQRALAPHSEIVWLAGNHEARLVNSAIDKLPQLVGLKRSGAEHALLSISNLCRFDDYDIKFIDGYPDGEYWANDTLRFEHGSLYSSTPGATARKYLAKGVSTGAGHSHRAEVIYETISTRSGYRQIFAGSPGALCKITGVLPSSRTGVTAEGTQNAAKAEQWQQGIWVVKYETDGEQRAFLEPVQFFKGSAIFRGKVYVGKDRIDV